MAVSSTELEAVLSALLMPDNEVIKQAEARLKELSKTPQFIVAITERAGMSASPQASESCRLCISCRKGERIRQCIMRQLHEHVLLRVTVTAACCFL